MPLNTGITNSVPVPRKPPNTSQRPKSRNIVTPAAEVETLKSENVKGEPGIEKKNVQFLFGLLEQASNEREQMLKQLAEKEETIKMITKQRQLEESSFRKVLTTERKKFDKQTLDARNLLQRREDLLRSWSDFGASTATQMSENDSNSEECAKVVTLLKRTCKIIPDALNSSQKEKLNIQDQGGKEEDAAEGGGHERDVDDFTAEFGEDTHDDEDEIRNGLAENSIGGGHTMSGSILMDASQKKGNKRGKASPNRGKVDSRLNMGSGLLNDDADVKTVSMAKLASTDGISHLGASDKSESMHFQTLSNLSASKHFVHETGSAKKGVGLGSSSSHYEKSSGAKQQAGERGLGPKTLASASMDKMSNSSSNKYWWDHLVDEGDEVKAKGPGDTSGLVLGSRLDKNRQGKGSAGKKKASGDEDNEDDDDEEEEEEDNKKGADNANDSSAGGVDVSGEASVMSLCSADFRFSASASNI